MNITTIPSVTAQGKEQPRDFQSFQEFATWLKENPDIIKEKKYGELWSPCVFTKGRQEADATEVSALCLDFDGDDPDLSLIRRLGLEHFAHQTFSDGWRVCLALERPVAARDWRLFWENATKKLNFETMDVSCKNVSRFYFFPVAGKPFNYTPGRALPVDDFLKADSSNEDLSALKNILLRANKVDRLSEIRLALAGKPVAPEGERNNVVSRLGFYLGKFVVPDTFSYESVHSLLHRGLALPGKEPKSEWEAVFRKSWDEGRKERAEKRAAAAPGPVTGKEWAAQLQMRTSLAGEATIISNTHNATVILENEGSYRFRENLLEGKIEYAEKDEEFHAFDDVASINICNWLQRHFRVALSRIQVFEQVQAVARKSPYDPVASYLEALTWDGSSRLDSFLVSYFGAADTPIDRAYGKRFLTSMVARALRPGCKVDTVLVLRGQQGLKKSTALRTLAAPWFSDTKIIIGDKDSYALAASSWLHEFGELAALKRADLETTKAFFSAQEDYYRPVWGRVHIKRPRRCVFVATTNDEEFLRDVTGNRRWWVVDVTDRIDLQRLAADRDQLFAEAVHLFKAGEQWHLTDAEESLHTEHVSQFEDDGVSESHHRAIVEWWNGLPLNKRPTRVTVADVVEKAWNVPLDRVTRSMEVLAGRALKTMGFRHVRIKDEHTGKRVWAYEPPFVPQPSEVRLES